MFFVSLYSRRRGLHTFFIRIVRIESFNFTCPTNLIRHNRRTQTVAGVNLCVVFLARLGLLVYARGVRGGVRDIRAQALCNYGGAEVHSCHGAELNRPILTRVDEIQSMDTGATNSYEKSCLLLCLFLIFCVECLVHETCDLLLKYVFCCWKLGLLFFCVNIC